GCRGTSRSFRLPSPEDPMARWRSRRGKRSMQRSISMSSWFGLDIGWNPVARHVLLLPFAERHLDLARIEQAPVASAQLDLQTVLARRKREPGEVDLAG